MRRLEQKQRQNHVSEMSSPVSLRFNVLFIVAHIARHLFVPFPFIPSLIFIYFHLYFLYPPLLSSVLLFPSFLPLSRFCI